MFKFFSVLLVLILGLTGCATAKRLPAADLAQPEWIRHTGQAVWHYPSGVDLAGDIILALNGNRAFVQFTKGGQFPVVTARQEGKQWEAEFFSQRRVSGRAEPGKISWLQLAEAVRKGAPSQQWAWSSSRPALNAGSALPKSAPQWQWKLVNSRSGETIEGFFSE